MALETAVQLEYTGLSGIDKKNVVQTLNEAISYAYDGYRPYVIDEKSFYIFKVTDGVISYGKEDTTDLTEQVELLAHNITLQTQEIEELNTSISTMADALVIAQKQLDGSISQWFISDEPTLTNYPASTWLDAPTDTNKDTKDLHLGDLCYNINSGFAYRFIKNNGLFSWAVVVDEAITNAMKQASIAQDTADGKRTTFVTKPTKPIVSGGMLYQEGDMFIPTVEVYPFLAGKIYRANAESTTWDNNHWEQVDYTDDTTALIAVNSAEAAQQTATEAQESAQVANDLLADISSDDKLTPSEKQAILKEWLIIEAEHNANSTQAQTFGVSGVDYSLAYQDLANHLNNNTEFTSGTPLWLNSTNISQTTPINGAIFRNYFKAYYDARTALLNAISVKAKDTAIATASSDATTKVNNLQIGGRNLIIGSGVQKTIIGIGNGTTEQTEITTMYADLEQDTTYTFNCKTDGVYGITHGTDTVQVYLLKDGGYTAYKQMLSFPYSFSPSVSGRYFLRLDINKNNTTHTFSDFKIEKGNKATDYTPAPEDVANDIAIADQKATTANNLLADISNDDKLTPLEKQLLRKEWEIIASEKPLNVEQANSFAIVQERTNYTAKFQGLAYYLNNNVPLSSGLPSWIDDVNLNTVTTIVGATFRNYFKDYYDARTALLNAISVKAKDTAIATASSDATTKANTAQNNAIATASSDATTKVNNLDTSKVTPLQNSVTAIQNTLTDISSDSKFTPSEKQLVLKEWEIIKSEKTLHGNLAGPMGISLTNYNNAYQNLAKYLNNGVAYSSGTPTMIGTDLAITTDIDSATFRTTFKTYYDERTLLLNAVSNYNKSLANTAQTTANGKARRFSGASNPLPPYTAGKDIWSNGADLFECVVSRTTGSYVAGDFVKATSYDNTKTTIDAGIVTGGTLEVSGADSLIKAGITGDDAGDEAVRFWAGATKTNRYNAPFQVLQGGKIKIKSTIEGQEVNISCEKIVPLTDLINTVKNNVSLGTSPLSYSCTLYQNPAPVAQIQRDSAQFTLSQPAILIIPNLSITSTNTTGQNLTGAFSVKVYKVSPTVGDAWVKSTSYGTALYLSNERIYLTEGSYIIRINASVSTSAKTDSYTNIGVTASWSASPYFVYDNAKTIVSKNAIASIESDSKYFYLSLDDLNYLAQMRGNFIFLSPNGQKGIRLTDNGLEKTVNGSTWTAL